MSRIEEALRRATEATAHTSEQPADPSVQPAPPVIDAAAFADEFRFAEDSDASAEVTLIEAPAAAAAVELSPAALQAVGDDKLIVGADIKPAAVEQYRRAAAVLHRLQADRNVRVVMIASAIAGEGKTLTACNVALTLSESFRRRTLLIDADLRRPSVHRMFRLDNTSGLNEGLRADRDSKLPIAEVSPHLAVLPAGRPDPDPMSSLTSDRMRQIVDEASARFDWVVIDTPPIALLPDANLLAEMADVVLLVIGAGTTPIRLVDRAVKALDRNRIAGVVLNRVTVSATPYSYYDYYGHAPSEGRIAS